MVSGDQDGVTKAVKSCRNMKQTKTFTYGLKKTKYMTVKIGHEKNQEITEEVEAER